MNLVDLAILAVIALSVLLGLYKGLLPSLVNTAGLFIALIIAYFCYPLVSSWIAGHEGWLDMIVYFSEGSSHIPTAMTEYARTDVTALAFEDVRRVIEASGFTAPFDTYLYQNITTRVYAPQLAYLREYFDQSVADATLNMVSFVLCAGVSYIIASILIIFVGDTFRFPQFRWLDSVLGGGVAILRGFVILMVLFMMVPLVVNMLQIDFINVMVEESRFASWFLPDNWFFGWITPYV